MTSFHNFMFFIYFSTTAFFFLLSKTVGKGMPPGSLVDAAPENGKYLNHSNIKQYESGHLWWNPHKARRIW